MKESLQYYCGRKYRSRGNAEESRSDARAGEEMRNPAVLRFANRRFLLTLE